MQIHIARDGKATGPFSLEEVNRQLAAGTLTLTDQAWYEGAPAWMPLSAVPGVTGATAAAPRPAAVPKMPVATAVAASTAAAPVAIKKNEPLAIWALVLGLLGFFCCGPFGAIPAIVCGHSAVSKIGHDPGLQGRGMAITGLVLGYLWVIVFAFWLIFGGLTQLQQAIEQGMHK
jgi:hypothetical protein